MKNKVTYRKTLIFLVLLISVLFLISCSGYSSINQEKLDKAADSSKIDDNQEQTSKIKKEFIIENINSNLRFEIKKLYQGNIIKNLHI